jgi:hypothetical protein
MTNIRRADPATRRQTLLFLLVGALVAALLIAAFERYRVPLREWVLAEPAPSAQRVMLVFLLCAALLLAPLLAFAVCRWSLGERVFRGREFSLPGLRVIRDTPIITGEAAISRGRQLRVLALGYGIASVALGLLFRRLRRCSATMSPNPAINGTGQQLRYWAPSSLRLVVDSYRDR